MFKHLVQRLGSKFDLKRLPFSPQKLQVLLLCLWQRYLVLQAFTETIVAGTWHGPHRCLLKPKHTLSTQADIKIIK